MVEYKLITNMLFVKVNWFLTVNMDGKNEKISNNNNNDNNTYL